MDAVSPVYGLTGGIACGKSTVAELLRERDWTVIDSDAIAHRLMAPGQENWQKIVDAFGSSILNADQTINRRVLGDLVFREPFLRDKLNSLTHPAIRKMWHMERDQAWAEIRKSGKRTVSSSIVKIVVIIPLLFETGQQSEFQSIVCVGCSAASQRERMASRGLSPQQIDARLASQWSLEEKIKQSHILIWNEGSRETLIKQIERIPVT